MKTTRRRGVDTRPIAVFDSGVGGLTVAKEIFRFLPGERILYFGDTARYPYGPRSREAVCRMADECVGILVARDVKMVVIACNTVSAVAYGFLREKYRNVPIIGVIDPCVSAVVREVRSGTVGVIGTAATISCGIYEDKIAALAPEITTLSKACPLFVPLAEEGITTGPIADNVIDLYLRPFKKKGIKAIILGCTHYPFFGDKINKYFLGKVKVLDSATWTARVASETLKTFGLGSGKKRVAMDEHHFMVTDYPEKFKATGELFLGSQIPLVEKVGLPELNLSINKKH
jgi:glutamate racemase